MTDNPNALHTRQGKLAAIQKRFDQLQELLDDPAPLNEMTPDEYDKLAHLQIHLLSTYSQHQGLQYDPFLSPTHQPHRGSDVESWLRAKRDAQASSPFEDGGQPGIWYILDDILDEYRLRADIGIQLGDPIPDGSSLEVDPAPQDTIVPENMEQMAPAETLLYDAWNLIANGTYWDPTAPDAQQEKWLTARNLWRDRWHKHIGVTEDDPAEPARATATDPSAFTFDEPVHTHNLEDDCTPDCDGYVPSKFQALDLDWNADRGRGDIEP